MYLEQRIEKIEKELALIKSKNTLKEPVDYWYNLETSMASPFCKSNNITIKLSSIVDDTFIEKYSSTSPTISSWDEFDWSTSSDWASFNPCDNIPPYPDIIGSWDDNITNKENMITPWGFESEYDKSDKDFLEYLNTKPKNNLNMKTYTEQNIEKTFGKIVSKISVLHHCWEGDGYGYIVEKEGKKILVLTDHGNPYIATVSDLYSKISEYKTVIQETERAIFVLK